MFGNLFGRKTGGQAVPAPEERIEFDELMRGDLVVVFKHSTACPVSWAAHAQIARFQREHPETRVRLIPVQKERELSQRLAAATGIRHESPQVIVLRRGEAVASASHGEITADTLSEMLSDALPRG